MRTIVVRVFVATPAVEEPDVDHSQDHSPDDADPSRAEDTPGARGDDATLALPYAQEADPLAGFWESPSTPLALPHEAASGAGQPPHVRGWSNRRVLAVFGLAVAVVAATGLSLGLASGNPSGDAGVESAPIRKADVADRPQRMMPPAVTQARAVDSLLDRSVSARDGVVAAVVHTKRCAHISRNVRDLRAAAHKREQLVTKLSKLDIGAIPRGKQATTALRQAWNASAQADREFAAWAQRVGGPGGCPGGTPVQGSHYRQAVHASGVAGDAKARFVRLWNPVAATAGLPKRSEDKI